MNRCIFSFLTLFCLSICSSIQASDCCGSRWDEAPCTPVACAGCGDETYFNVTGDLLIWQLCRSDLDYAISAQDITNVYTGAHVRYIDTGFDLGLRLNGSYCSDCDGWQYAAQYTHFSSTDSDDIARPTTGASPAAIPTRMHPAVLTAARNSDTAHATIEVDYDVVDFLVSRPYFVSCSKLVNPFAGLRIVLLDQNFNATYRNLDFMGSDCTSRWKSEYCSLGFTGGTETSHKWCDWCNGVLTTFGRVGASLVVGENDSSLSQVPGAGGTVATLSVHDKDECLVVHGLEGSAGVRYETCHDWCGCCGNIVFTLGGETVYWSNTPAQRRGYDLTVVGPHSSSSNGHLAFVGFFASLALGF